MELPPLEVRFMSTVEAYRKSCGLPLMYPSKKRYLSPNKLQLNMGNCSTLHIGILFKWQF